MARKTASSRHSLAPLNIESEQPPTASSATISAPPSPLPIELGKRTSSFGERLVPVALSSLNLPELDSSRPLPIVHINKSSLVELKNACDDAVKSIMKDYQFTEIHTHTDIKLALGWLAVLIAAGTAGYSYKFGFEETKGVATAGVLAYFLLSGIQLLYAYYFQGSKIYIGKRKFLSKRIETEVIRISSRTLPSSSSPPQPPRYLLNFAYRRSANKNKSLIRRKRELVEASFGDLVDTKGGVEQERIKDWVGDVIGRLVGASGDDSNVPMEGTASTATSPAREKQTS